MVKQNKIFCIDEDIVGLLKKEDNASALVNKILRHYYDEKEFNNLSPQELERQLKRLDILEKHMKELKEFDNGK